MKIKIEIIVIVAIIVALFYNVVTRESRPDMSDNVQCDPMEYSRLKVVLDECASGTMHDTWGK